MTLHSRRSMIGQFRAQYPAIYRLDLEFGDCKMAVWANQTAIAEELKQYFGHFVRPISENPDMVITVHNALSPESDIPFTLKQPDPGKTKIKEEYAQIAGGRVVRKRLTGMFFVFGEGDHLAIGPCRKNLNQVVNFINSRYIEWLLCRGCLLGHAAGVILNGKGLALAGFSGAGKSTLALHLMNHGAVFVSNDRLMIEESGDTLFMHGVAKLPRVNPGTILSNPRLIQIMPIEERSRFASLSPEALWKTEHKYDAPIDQCFGDNRFVLKSQMHALAILNWNKDGGDTSAKVVNLTERQDLLPAFMKSSGLFFLPHRDCTVADISPESYASILSKCKVIEITGGIDFEKAASLCISHLC